MQALGHPANLLLRAVPASEWELMRKSFHKAQLEPGRLLYEPGDPLRELFFPEAGLLSSVAAFENGQLVEVVTTGREGMASVAAILGGDFALTRQLVQVPGEALMIEIADFRRFANLLPGFRAILQAYSRAVFLQVAQTGACNAVHPIEERAARWLLTCHDSVGGDTFQLTQEYLAQMLGVSRPSVSMVARTLQRAGLIRYVRGRISILDRAGLKEAACECYQAIRNGYSEVLAPEASGGAAARIVPM